MLLDNMIGLKEDSRVMAHGRLYKIEEKLNLYIFFPFSFYHTKVSFFSFLVLCIKVYLFSCSF
jgi:hypothetical protein